MYAMQVKRLNKVSKTSSLVSFLDGDTEDHFQRISSGDEGIDKIVANFDKRVKMDADYVKERSILSDMIIIFKTPWAMISGKGAL